MPGVPHSVILRTARAGSLLAVALTLWYASSAWGLPFAAFVALFAAAAVGIGMASRRQAAETGTENDAPAPTPLIPLLVVIGIVLAPAFSMLHGMTGREPHWFARSDDAFTILAARGLAQKFPPPDLSWAGQPLRYHLGAAMLDDLLRRVTHLPVHAIHDAVAPILLRLIVIAGLLLLTFRIAPTLPPRWRVWTPLAAGALPTIDLFNLVWHMHDIQVRGSAALSSTGMPIASAGAGLLASLAFDSSVLALSFAIILAATWRETTWPEKAALLFGVYLSKAQIFLAVGAAFGAVALLELARKRWRPLAAGALALACVSPTLQTGSTYGSAARLAIGCGALCEQLLLRHHLEHRLHPGLVLAIETLVLLASLHVFTLVIALGIRRRWDRPEFLFAAGSAAGGLFVAFGLRLVASEELRTRFLAVHSGVADRLFMPLPVYLDRILDVSVAAAFDTSVLLPILAVPLLGAWMLESPRRNVRRASGALIVTMLILGTISIARTRRAGKEVSADALATLRALPPDGGSVLTNDLAWDDASELHLPLLNIWAPAVSGHQFWASAFMFTFQHPDSGDRLARVQWFFSSAATPQERLAFARKAGIEYIFLRGRGEGSFDGWTLVARHGEYALFRR